MSKFRLRGRRQSVFQPLRNREPPPTVISQASRSRRSAIRVVEPEFRVQQSEFFTYSLRRIPLSTVLCRVSRVATFHELLVEFGQTLFTRERGVSSLRFAL